MKKKYLLIGIAFVFGIAIIIFSFYWPPVSKDDAKGAFTKTEKYKKKILADGDIVFNSQLINDTTALNKAIVDLVQFGDFAIYAKTTLNNVWMKDLEPFKVVPEIKNAIDQILDFSKFIDNNNNSVEKLVITLLEHRVDSKKSLTSDIESQLLQFYNYANQFLMRDSIFESTIGNIDIAVEDTKIKKNSIALLKDLRDRIVLDNFAYGVSIGDSSKMVYSANQVLNSPQKALKIILGLDNAVGYSAIANGFQSSNSFASLLTNNLAIHNFNENQLQLVTNTLNIILNSLKFDQNTVLKNEKNMQGANGPIFYMGNNNYFGLAPNAIGVIFNEELIKSTVSNNQKNITAGNVPQMGLYCNLNTFNLTWSNSVLKGIEIGNSQTLALFQQFQLGVFVPNSISLFEQNFPSLKMFQAAI